MTQNPTPTMKRTIESLPKTKHALVIQGSTAIKQNACIKIVDWATRNGIPVHASFANQYNIPLWIGSRLIAGNENAYDNYMLAKEGYTIHQTPESFIKTLADNLLPDGYVDEGEGESQWISIEDRLPENDDWVLVWIETEHYAKISYYRPNIGGWGGKNYNVAHWMPLPQPPKTKKP